LALGSNLGDRESHLKGAVHGLASRDITSIRCASVYLTEPKDVTDQPWFLNTVVEGHTALDPTGLLTVCLAVESENQRTRGRPGGPRTLDIDILFYGNAVIREPGLEVPHPRLYDRRFVLEPLAELAADFIDPVTGKAVRELLDACSDVSYVERLQHLA
jgi:2-amino-4-hydroxy-6-hydroxymethyldihydropteridine diphosphokinase